MTRVTSEELYMALYIWASDNAEAALEQSNEVDGNAEMAPREERALVAFWGRFVQQLEATNIIG